jgi:GTP-binding protein
MNKSPADRLFTHQIDFIAGASTPDSLPEAQAPEIAVWGRSNVGKSSLLNALTGRKNLARVSKTPGRTQQINFFSIGGEFILTDLPGYGYAKAAKHKIAAWEELIYAYFSSREELRGVLLLIDARHGLKDVDMEAIDHLSDLDMPFAVVLTKADKAEDGDTAAKIIAQQLGASPLFHPEVFVTSAEKQIGISDLRQKIAQLSGVRL